MEVDNRATIIAQNRKNRETEQKLNAILAAIQELSDKVDKLQSGRRTKKESE